MMVVIRYISKVLVWILTVLVIIGSIGNPQTHPARPGTVNTDPAESLWHSQMCWYTVSCLTRQSHHSDSNTVRDASRLWSFAGGTAVLWWLYVDHRKALNNSTLSVFGKEVASDNVKALLVYAIGATIFTVCLSAQVLYLNGIINKWNLSWSWSDRPGGSPDRDVHHEEACGSHHLPVPRGR